jgi:carbamoyl-phosphate synthase large subunit
LQAFVQVDGSVVFIECNPRVGGASSLSFEAGLDTPHWSLMEAAGQRVTPRVGLYRRGLTLIRYSADRFLSS